MGRLGAVADIVLHSIRAPIYEIALGLGVAISLVMAHATAYSVVSFVSGSARALVLASAGSSFTTLIAFVLSVVCGWSVASMASRGEFTTILSMPVSRRAILALAAVGCFAAPLGIVAVSAGLVVALYSMPPREAVAGVLSVMAVPSVVFAVVLALAALAKSRVGCVVGGFLTWVGMGIASGVALALLHGRALSAVEAIALGCLNPLASAALAHAASLEPVTLALTSSLIDLCAASAACTAMVLVGSRRWEPA